MLPQKLIYAHLSELALFVQVVDAGSFSAASRATGQTPSAISKQIKKLEEVLQLRLFERSTRQIRLTESGQEICLHARKITAAAHSIMESSVRQTTMVEGLVRISAPKAIARQLVHPLLPTLLKAYPHLQLDLLVSDEPIDMISGGVDIAIRLGEPPLGVVARPLFAVETVLCASPMYLEQHGTPQHPEQLAQHSCLHLGVYPDDAVWTFQNEHHKARVSVHVKGRYASNHSEVRREGALEGLGIARLPHFTVTHYLASGELVRVLPSWKMLGHYQGTSWLLYSADRYRTPRVRLVVDTLLAHIGGRQDLS